MTRPRGNRRRLRGVVVRDGAAKTITVQVTRRFPHPRYRKMVRRNTRIAAHDEQDSAHVGDVVEIVECRPMSRAKRYRLVRIVERNPEHVVADAGADQPQTEATPAS